MSKWHQSSINSLQWFIPLWFIIWHGVEHRNRLKGESTWSLNERAIKWISVQKTVIGQWRHLAKSEAVLANRLGVRFKPTQWSGESNCSPLTNDGNTHPPIDHCSLGATGGTGFTGQKPYSLVLANYIPATEPYSVCVVVAVGGDVVLGQHLQPVSRQWNRLVDR